MEYRELLHALNPVLNDGVYVYSCVPTDADIASIQTLGTFREAEGITVICAESEAIRAGLPVLFRAAWITLTVASDLHSVGLTAAVSRALADAGIGCNIVAATNHDHLFVPIESAREALALLEALQNETK